MGYQFKGKNTADVVRNPAENVAAILKLRETDRAFIAAMEARNGYTPTVPEEGTRCGTNPGYQKHINHKTTICQPCRAAHTLYVRHYRQRIAA